MLKRLHVDNYRCLTNFDVVPGRVAALVGPNGSGKSTVFDILGVVQSFLGAETPVKDLLQPWSRTRWDPRLAQRIEVEVEIREETYSYSLEVVHTVDARDPVVSEERLSAGGELLYRLVNAQVELYGDVPKAAPRTSFPFAATRSFLPLLEPRPDNSRITVFKEWVAGIWLFSLSPRHIQLFSEDEAAAVDRAGANFVSWYRTLVQESPRLPENLRVDLQPIIPGFQDVWLQQLGPKSKAMSVKFELAGKSYNLALSELSDGQRALLVLYTILRTVAAKASLLVFDEPDNFIASSEIQPWLSELREVVNEANRGTLLVISHHPEVIDYLAPDQALVLSRSDEGPTRIHPLNVDLEKGLSASEWLRLNPGERR